MNNQHFRSEHLDSKFVLKNSACALFHRCSNTTLWAKLKHMSVTQILQFILLFLIFKIFSLSKQWLIYSAYISKLTKDIKMFPDALIETLIN